jgi:hypothetical protein
MVRIENTGASRIRIKSLAKVNRVSGFAPLDGKYCYNYDDWSQSILVQGKGVQGVKSRKSCYTLEYFSSTDSDGNRVDGYKFKQHVDGRGTVTAKLVEKNFGKVAADHWYSGVLSNKIPIRLQRHGSQIISMLYQNRQWATRRWADREKQLVQPNFRVGDLAVFTRQIKSTIDDTKTTIAEAGDEAVILEEKDGRVKVRVSILVNKATGKRIPRNPKVQYVTVKPLTLSKEKEVDIIDLNVGESGDLKGLCSEGNDFWIEVYEKQDGEWNTRDRLKVVAPHRYVVDVNTMPCVSKQETEYESHETQDVTQGIRNLAFAN